MADPGILTPDTVSELGRHYVTYAFSPDGSEQAVIDLAQATGLEAFRKFARSVKRLADISIHDCVFDEVTTDSDRNQHLRKFVLHWAPPSKYVEFLGGPEHGKLRQVENPKWDATRFAVMRPVSKTFVEVFDPFTPAINYVEYRYYGFNTTTHRWVHTPDGERP